MPYDYNNLYPLKLFALYGLLFLFFIISLVKIPIFGADDGRLSFILIGIYFWTIYRPNLLPYPVIFVCGFLLDLLSGGIVGLNALCFMVIVMIVRNQRRFLLGQSWPVVWAGYCVAVSVVIFLQYLGYSMAASQFLPFIPLLFNLIITYLLYPLVLPLMMFFNRLLFD